jgi:integrase
VDKQSWLLQNRPSRADGNDFSKRLGHESPMNARGLNEDLTCKLPRLFPTLDREKITTGEEQRIGWNDLLSSSWHKVPAQHTGMTVAEFVEHKFLPERVSQMRYSGRTHYQAMLKHVLTPDEVDRIFRVDTNRSKARLKAIPDWPYLGEIRLCDTQSGHVQQLALAALNRGYSSQTVMHLRNVVGAIFSHAKKERCFAGENPANFARGLKVTPQHAGKLTLAQTREAIKIMKHPEREMALLMVFTDMNIAEICGLQWNWVNLTGEDVRSSGEMIPPNTIAIRKQWYRGRLGDVAKSRARNLTVSDQLSRLLLALRDRAQYTDPGDFVFVSRVGKPINETNMLTRHLKPIAEQLKLPSLSWQVFRRTRKALVSEFGMRFESIVAMMLIPSLVQEAGMHHIWHCRTQRSRTDSDAY